MTTVGALVWAEQAQNTDSPVGLESPASSTLSPDPETSSATEAEIEYFAEPEADEELEQTKSRHPRNQKTASTNRSATASPTAKKASAARVR